MQQHIVITVITNDRPGVVEKLADTIHQHGGNWLESQLSHLAGKFAGIVHVAVPTESVTQLQTALESLKEIGIRITLDATDNTPASNSSVQQLRFELTGMDRPGIVKEVSKAFAESQVNMLELETECSSMPWSGEPLFEATGIISAPPELSIDTIELSLEPIALALGLDITLKPVDS